MQRRAGSLAEADHVGRGVHATLPDAFDRLMAMHRLVVAASLDESGRVWASLLTGPHGFLRRVDERLLLIGSHPAPFDPLRRNLAVRSEMGLLAIDLATRRRLRFNGRALHDPERGIFLVVDQVYGNCPKYIQARRVEPVGGSPSRPETTSVLSPGQQAMIAASDTFFIASSHPEGGADASHRGGAPGFVRILDGSTLAFGDYAGNNMFNTLGNLVAQPRAGLLFLDFEKGTVLQLTGRARLDREPGTIAAFRGARGVVVVFEVEEAMATRDAGVRGVLLEPSPVNP
jgi:uncharacterized protein